MRLARVLLAAAAALSAAALAAAPAFAAPAWRLDVLSNTTAAPGQVHTYVMQVTNVGNATADTAAVPLRLEGTLPDGLTVLRGPFGGLFGRDWSCPGLVVGAPSFACQYAGSPLIAPAGFKTFTVDALVGGTASGTVTSSFTVTGGDPSQPTASKVDPTRISFTPPPFGVDALDGEVIDAAGEPYSQAGGHPYAASVSLDFNTVTDPARLKGALWPVEPVKDVFADLPPGLVGDPTATDRCTAAQLAAGGIEARTQCPSSAQVGTALVRFNGLGARTLLGPIPVYNMVPPPDVPARFGFNVSGTLVTLDAELRSATDYGLSVHVRNVSEGLGVAGVTLTFWGVPASSAHTPERACPGFRAPWDGGPPCPVGGALKAFLRNPTSCTSPGVGLPVVVRLDSWKRPGEYEEASFTSHLPPGYPWAPGDWGPQLGPTGCLRVPFAGVGLSAAPGSLAAGAPSGFSFVLTVPQSDDPDPVATSDIRRIVARLPVGVRVNPSAADGLLACSAIQVGLSSLDDATCPDGSRVGSLSIETPLLEEPLDGGIYLAAPRGGNPFGSLLAIYLVARGPGVIVKLAGRVDADPFTGQLTATFDELPQLPFSRVRLAFDGGPRSPMVNPPVCGAYVVEGELWSWSGEVAMVSAPFTISAPPVGSGAGSTASGLAAGCPAASASRRFAPGFSAGVESATAGGSSPFHLRLTRTDADDELSGVRVELPQGLLARIGDVDLCSDRDATAGRCPESSRIGSVTAGAGAGPLPFFISGGGVYLTGPYKGAPFGLSIVEHAVAGPFDLGEVVVRAAVLVDRRTAVVSVVTDPLPTILEGIPLQLRDVRVAIDRPGFMVNPTSCAEQAVGGVVESLTGLAAQVSARFQAADCAGLPFHPRLRITVGGPGRTNKGVSTPLIARLRQSPGEANIRSISVTLPDALNARLEVVRDACTPDAFATGHCERARIGTAVAVTPLLRDPLRGNVYLVRTRTRGLPDIIIALRGQVDVDLTGRVAIPGGRLLRATFAHVPDVPITSFILRLAAGPRGVVGTAERLCLPRSRPRPARLQYAGQSGRRRTVARGLVIDGC